MINFKRYKIFSVMMVSLLTIGTVIISPVSLAQEVQQASVEVDSGATGDSGSSEPAGSGEVSAESASGSGSPQESDSVAGANQGVDQGAGQGTNQGGPTLESLGITQDENGNYDTSSLGSDDPRLGASQGSDQGTYNGATAANTDTGAGSDNSSSVTTDQTDTTQVDNSGTVTNEGSGVSSTGQNSSTQNTGPGSVGTGDAGVGVQQLTIDNLNATGSQSEVSHTTTPGTKDGDVVLSFDPGTGAGIGESFTSVNSVTGADSTNEADVSSSTTRLNEIQNDGEINNTLNAGAVTGLNEATQNTGSASIDTGNANVAATLINFLNTNVIDGNLWIEVMDIFGDLNGNVVIPSDVIAFLEKRQRELLVNAVNEGTGSNSQNTAEVAVNNSQDTLVENTAEVENNIDVNAITGQNTATQNTGNSTVETGDVQAAANTVTMANTNVVDGNLGIIIVNALNKWLGFLVGQNGTLTPIDHDYTTEIIAQNNQTGADSNNNAEVSVNNGETNEITNDARISNNLNLDAITGQNTAVQNTGDASIKTGDANVHANVINIVNTNIVRGNLFVAVVNVFGNWMGDLLFGDQNLSTLAAAGATGGAATVNGQNNNTGSNSVNDVLVELNNNENTDIQNNAEITNNLSVNADTGHNEADRNTGLGSIDTGDAIAALHARNIANLTVASVAPAWSDISASLTNATTGADSQNTIDVTVNDERNINVSNDAQVDTAVGAIANTGFNTANRNTLGAAIRTGLAQADAFIANLLNQTWFVGDGSTGSLALNGTNNQTGDGSTNTTATEIDSSATAVVSNNADVQNNGELDANSGNNQANQNTGNATVDSGDALVSGGAQNDVNAIKLAGNTGGLDLTAENTADINNDFTGSANSGGNETNKNTGGGAVADDDVVDDGDDNDNDEEENDDEDEEENGNGTGGGGDTETEGGNGGGNGGVGGGSDENTPVIASANPKVNGTMIVGGGAVEGDNWGLGGDGNYFGGAIVKTALGAGDSAAAAAKSARFPVADLLQKIENRSPLGYIAWSLVVLAGILFARVYFAGRNVLALIPGWIKTS